MGNVSMLRANVLKLADSAPFFEEEVEFSPAGIAQDAHSLHYSLVNSGAMRPEIARHIIQRFSSKGQVVMDPFCSCGSSTLEANLQGRIALGSDISPLAVKIAGAKAAVADITEVTLRLQQINVRRPICLSSYDETFSSFYDIDTFRELVNLRRFLTENADRVSRFIELLAMSLLHGQSAGYFSAYSFPQFSLSPARQKELNLKRSQVPDYRAVVPRLLRKAALVLRDGIPSALRQLEFRNRFEQADARDLSFVPSGSVDLIVTTPPQPGRKVNGKFWLRSWFAGTSARTGAEQRDFGSDIESWRESMNEVLLETARIARHGARAALELPEWEQAGRRVQLDAEVNVLIEENLGRYWECECLLLDRLRTTAIKNQLRERDEAKLMKRSRILVLRRR